VARISYKDTDLLSVAYGVKDKKKPDVKPDGDTIFRVGSLSKVFVVRLKLFLSICIYIILMFKELWIPSYKIPGYLHRSVRAAV